MSTEITDAALDDLREVLSEIISSGLTTKANEPPKPTTPERRADRGALLRPQERRPN